MAALLLCFRQVLGIFVPCPPQGHPWLPVLDRGGDFPEAVNAGCPGLTGGLAPSQQVPITGLGEGLEPLEESLLQLQWDPNFGLFVTRSLHPLA